MRVAALILFFFFISFAKAQVTFVDVNPNSCVCVATPSNVPVTLSTNWDLDGNSVNDFVIVSDCNYSKCTIGFSTTRLNALGANSVAGDVPISGYNAAFMLNAGDTINTQSSWLTNSYLRFFSYFSGFYGTYWALGAGTFKYAGVKFYAGSTLYYGWMRLSVGVNCGIAQVIVSEYAYSTSLILAGQGSVTGMVKHYVNKDISVYPNPSNGSFKVELSNELKDSEIVLINGLGQTVKTQKLTTGTNLISTSGLSQGIYSYVLLQDQLPLSQGKLSLE